MMKPGQTRSNPVKPEGNSIDVAQTESNQIKPARMGGIAMMIKIRSGAVTQSWAGFGPVKPSQTQSNPVKPSQTSGVCLFGLNEGCLPPVAACQIPSFGQVLAAVQAVEHAASISVEDYLAGELKSEIRHEYIGGLVYAMAGTSSEHNIICQNLLIAVRSHLRGKPCQVFMESVKLRLRTSR
jgi:hypothetical protein